MKIMSLVVVPMTLRSHPIKLLLREVNYTGKLRYLMSKLSYKRILFFPCISISFINKSNFAFWFFIDFNDYCSHQTTRNNKDEYFTGFT